MELLSIEQAKLLIADGAWVIDSRPPAFFVQGMIPRSVHIPAGSHFTAYLEQFVEPDMKLVLITETGQETAIAREVVKTGFASLAGTVAGGYEAWIAAGGHKDLIIDITTEEFELDFNYDEFYLLDVRMEDLYEKDHLEHAENLPLPDIEDAIPDLNADNMYYFYGNSFEDAAFAASLFRRAGFYKLRIVNEGYEALRSAKLPVVKKKTTRPDPNFSAN